MGERKARKKAYLGHVLLVIVNSGEVLGRHDSQGRVGCIGLLTFARETEPLGGCV